MEPERHPRKCTATKRNGGSCERWAIEGGTVCPTHGGSTNHVRGKASERRQQAQARKALGEVPTENVDPAEALLWLVSAKFTEVHWLRQRVIEFDDSAAPTAVEDDHDGDARADSLTWGTTKQTTGFDPETGMVSSTVREAAPNIWWRLLREAEDQLAKYSTAALRAGVERRQIELQEAQAVHLAGAINRILEALELTSEQQAQVPRIVPEVLRALPMEGRG